MIFQWIKRHVRDSLKGPSASATVALMAVAGSAGSVAAQDMVPGQIVASGATLEKLFDGGFWTEGPAVGPDGKVYFCDITFTFATDMDAGNIWVFDPATGETELFMSPSGMAAGIMFDRDGAMVVAQGADFGGRSVVRTDVATGRSKIIAGLYNGHPFNAPNDLDIDAAGRIYFTDPRYFGYEAIEQPVKGVYRIDTDGTVHLILADVGMPNGIALSPDEKTLYVAELDPLVTDWRIAPVPQRSGGQRLLAYDLSAEGLASNQRVVADYGSETGPDGLTVDSDGNVYAAVSAASRRGIHVYAPEGDEIAFIPVPGVDAVTNVTLGTHEGQTYLYVTATSGLYRIATTVTGRREAATR